MRTKLFLTSCITMGFVAPAMAENFPINGLMQENKTYTNAATSTNMDGVYEGTVNATAEYENILYNIVAGNYLPGGSEETNGSQCTPGNFCTGLTNATYSESDQGLTSCSTLGDGSYTLSPAGATNGNMCYKTCSASCTNPTAPAHSTNVTYGHETSNGTWNYGSTCNAVAPTCSINFDCVNGYHKRPDITREQAEMVADMLAMMQGASPSEEEKNYVIDMILGWDSLGSEYQSQLKTFLSLIQSLPKISGLVTIKNNGGIELNDFNTYRYTKDLNGTEKCYTSNKAWLFKNNVEEIDCAIATQQNSELAQFRQTAQNGDWFVFGPDRNFSVAGHSRCVSDWVSYSTPCELSYSMIDGQTATSDYIKESTVDGWNFDVSEGFHADSCVTECSFLAADSGLLYMLFAGAALASDQINLDDNFINFMMSISVNNPTNIPYMCDANTITINWGDTDSEDIETNNAGTATYGSDIRTPVKAQTKPGKRFTGWRFVAPTPVQSGN